MDFVLGVIFTGMECFAAVLFFDAFFERRWQGSRFWGRFAAYALGFGVLLNVLDLSQNVLKLLFVLAAFMGFHFGLYRGGMAFRLVIIGLFYALMCSVEAVWVFASLAVTGLDVTAYIKTNAFTRANAVCFNLTVIVLAFLIKRIHHFDRSAKVSWKWWLPLLFIPFGSLGLVLLLTRSVVSGATDENVLLITSAFLAFVNILIMALVDWMERNARFREEALALSARVNAQAQNIEALSAAYAAQRKITHDFNTHLQTLAGLLKNGPSGAASDYVQALQQSQTERIFMVNTHNAAVDALLNQKALAAQKKQIDIRFEVNDLSGLQIKSVDLSVIIGNLLDNAIEASEKLPVTQREIVVKALLDESLFLSIRNRCNPVKAVQGNFPTTKPEPWLHGFGLANVKFIVKKYTSQYVLEYDKGWFLFCTELPNTLL